MNAAYRRPVCRQFPQLRLVWHVIAGWQVHINVLVAAALLENVYLTIFTHLQTQAGRCMALGRLSGTEQD